jgi:hypothetical protein
MTALTGVTTPVLDSFAIAQNEARMPLAVVAFGSEVLEDRNALSDGGETARRVLSANVGVCSFSAESLDDLAEEIESRLAPTFGDGVDHQIESTSFADPERGERDFFSLSVQIQFRYRLDSRSPDRLAE